MNALKHAFLAILLVAAVHAQTENLWHDPSFEQTGTSSDARTGKKSLHFSMETPKYYQECGSRRLIVEPLAVYKVEAFVKANVPKGHGHVLVTYGWDSFGWAYSTRVNVKKLDTWTRQSTTFCMPGEEAFFATIVLSNASNASITVDDLSITKIKSGKQHLAELLAKPNPTNLERQLLARYFFKIKDLKKLANLQNGANDFVKADIACLLAKANDDLQAKIPHIVDMLVHKGMDYYDGKKRIAEFFPLYDIKTQIDICVKAIERSSAPASPAKAFNYLHQDTITQNAPLKAQRSQTQQAIELLKKIPKQSKAFAAAQKTTETLAKSLATLDEQLANLGNATITIDGKTISPDTHVIVLPKKPSPSEKHAVREFNSHLERMSGMTLQTIGEDAADKRIPIIIGKAHKALAKAKINVNFKKLGIDGIHIASNQGVLALAGNQRGVLYAVYTFLEDYLGCRWFAEDCIHIPTSGTFSFNKLKHIYIPPLEYRDTDYPTARALGFCVRNKLNGMYVKSNETWGGGITYSGFVHTFNALVPVVKYGNAHPEYYSEIDGKRILERTQLCLTNPDVLKIAIDSVRKRIIDAKGRQVIISVSQNDNQRYCKCKKCTELAEKEGSQAGPLLHFVNALTEDIVKDYPNQIIDTLAYQYTRKPPKFVKPHPNVAIRLCSIECCFTHPLESCPYNARFVDDIKGWSKICKRLHIWDYVINYAHTIMPFPDLYVLMPNIDFFIRNGVTGIYEEANYFSRGGEFAELRTYLMAKALWNPKTADTQKNIREFTDAFYGAGAPFIRTYIENLHRLVCSNHKLHVGIYAPPSKYLNHPDFIEESINLFEQARKAVANNPTFLHRVNVAMMPIIYTKLALAQTHYSRKDKELTLNTPDSVELYKRFKETAIAEKVTHVREGQWGLIKNWFEIYDNRSTSIPIVTLENDFLKLEILPSQGGRLWSATHKKSGRELLHVVGNDKQGYVPRDSGFETYASEGYRGPGWNDPFIVRKHTKDTLILTRKLDATTVLSRVIKLVPGKAAFTFDNYLVSSRKRNDLALRIHPAFAVTSTANATLTFTAMDGKPRSFSLANPSNPLAEKERWLSGNNMPNGSWSIKDAKSGLTIVNTFDANKVKLCYCNWNGKDARVNLEQWSAPTLLQANFPLELKNTYEIIPH